MTFLNYKIVETDSAPLISESRTSVYDVMLAQKEGLDFYQICVTYNLRPVQVQLALAYIEQNRAKLELELEGIVKQQAEHERHYRAMATEIQKKIDQYPMTPQRAKFYALRDKIRQSEGV